MPTSAAGNRRRRFAPARRSHGSRAFTLIELLVVMAIIALGMAGVALAMRDTGQATLDREAERLAALFEAARAQSRASGVAVRWHLTQEGFIFEGVDEGALPRHWLAEGIQVTNISANGVRVDALQLGPEPIIAAQQVALAVDSVPGRSLLVATDGLRPFSVASP
jgi:general secretion pathway protein H